ncbi:hypothetical protein K0M31_006479 [Melipona bicolor]|uniref:Uncharacterized protein n=1 Tax=Melipona bicolor TaxID=60889 RepID=A0AA40KLT1_9HYME|nr:hypothetical protein K0M31_006479 [Melipona bicolor]
MKADLTSRLQVLRASSSNLEFPRRNSGPRDPATCTFPLKRKAKPGRPSRYTALFRNPISHISGGGAGRQLKKQRPAMGEDNNEKVARSGQAAADPKKTSDRRNLCELFELPRERRSQMLNVNGNSERNALLDSFSMNMRYPLRESSHPYRGSTTVDLLQTRYRLIG